VVKIYRKAIIVADDLTGACDTSSQFSKLGYNVAVAIDQDDMKSLIELNDVIALSTNTRGMEPDKAYEIVGRVVSIALDAANDAGIRSEDILWYKKIDSTLRGNIVEESIAMYETLNAELMIFAPAYPRHGRTTVGGIHLVNGVPVTQTYFGRDTRAPARSPNIAEYFAGLSYSHKHIYISDLRSGTLGQEICNYRILSSDIETEEDFRHLIDSTPLCRERHTHLWVGSAGLAEWLAWLTVIATPCRGPILLCVGSSSDTTRMQLARLIGSITPCMLLLNVEKLLLEDFNQLYNDIMAELSACLNRGSQIVVITSAYEEWQLKQAKAVASALGLSMARISEYISTSLGKLCASVTISIGLDNIGGIILSGGDTAYAVLKQLGLDRLRIVGEVEPGVPVLGTDKGVKVVTKAGGFGDIYSLLRAVYRLGGWCG